MLDQWLSGQVCAQLVGPTLHQIILLFVPEVSPLEILLVTLVAAVKLALTLRCKSHLLTLASSVPTTPMASADGPCWSRTSGAVWACRPARPRSGTNSA